ncbi:MAG TPA: GFA family protein [Phenylobacterium sp.]|nr:GFA family protein [Phenylobacterium sp.]
MSEPPLHSGSCLCGAVRFEIAGPLPAIQICHCGACRKAQGAPFATNIPVAAGNFRLLSGERALRAYESSPGKERVFCGTCGAPLMSRLTHAPETVRIRAGLLDPPVEAKLGSHAYADSKADWWPIEDDLPRFPGARPA